MLLYVNGVPLVFIGLKTPSLKSGLLSMTECGRLPDRISSLYLTNTFCVLSNGIETKVGSFAADWEYFFNWLRTEDERERIDREQIREKGTA